MRSNRTLEYLYTFLRLRSSEALGKSALAFPGSSISPGESYFPGCLKQNGWTRYTLPPLHKLTLVPIVGKHTLIPSCYSYAFLINVDVYYGEHPHGSEPDVCSAPEGL